MKCIQDKRATRFAVTRVSDAAAQKAVKSGEFAYVPKSYWKGAGRP